MFQRLQPPVVELAVLWKKRSENWSRPIPSIGLGRQTTTTLMHVLLVFCCMCVAVRLLGCEGVGNAGVLSGGGVVSVSAYMGGTRGSGVFSSSCDVLEMSVVRGVGGSVLHVCVFVSGRGGMCCG